MEPNWETFNQADWMGSLSWTKTTKWFCVLRAKSPFAYWRVRAACVFVCGSGCVCSASSLECAAQTLNRIQKHCERAPIQNTWLAQPATCTQNITTKTWNEQQITNSYLTVKCLWNKAKTFRNFGFSFSDWSCSFRMRMRMQLRGISTSFSAIAIWLRRRQRPRWNNMHLQATNKKNIT